MKNTIFLLGLLITFTSFSQDKMIVFFKDKSSQNYDETQLFSKRGIERRKNKSVVLNHYDLPINPGYLNALAVEGKVEKKSKWLNAIVYTSNFSPDELIEKFSFIERIILVDTQVKPRVKKELDLPQQKVIDYGYANGQIQQLNLSCLHDSGYTGNSIYVAIIDAGFEGMDTVSYFDSLYLNNRVLDTFDFVLNQTYVYGYSQHGTMVSSCIFAEKHVGNEKYVGTAKDVDVALYRSENTFSETMIEEFDLVRALERCDSVGVDIANISLGYFDFDDSTTNHVYADLDGNTTVAAKGVNIAFSKGIAVVMSAGNSGPNYISTPCDADSGLCVGAVDEFGNYAYFSSVGPNADGQVKPDVVAQGQNAFVVSPFNLVMQGNGTSFSSPIMCGATACLIEANPTKTIAEIFDAIRMSANQTPFPDSLRGYGIPNFCIAQSILNTGAGISEIGLMELVLYPNPATNELTVSGFEENKTVEYVIYNSLGGFEMTGKKVTTDGRFKINVGSISAGYYQIELLSEGKVIGREKLIIVD